MQNQLPLSSFLSPEEAACSSLLLPDAGGGAVFSLGRGEDGEVVASLPPGEDGEFMSLPPGEV